MSNVLHSHGTHIANNAYQVKLDDDHIDNVTLHTNQTQTTADATTVATTDDECNNSITPMEIIDDNVIPNDEQLVEHAINELRAYILKFKDKSQLRAKDKLEKHRTVERLFNIVKENRNLATHMHVSGILIQEDIRIPVKNVLMDTGALHGSYVSQRFIDKHRHELQANIHAASGSVKFGNKDHVHKITEVLIMPMLVVCKHTQRTYKLLTVYSIVELTNDFIIGLPDLADTLAPLFVKAFLTAATQLQSYNDKKTLILNRPNDKNVHAIAADHHSSIGRRSPNTSIRFGKNSELITEIESVEFDSNSNTSTDIPDGTYLEPWEINESDQAPEEDHGHMEQQDFTHAPIDELNYMSGSEYDAAKEKYHLEISKDRPPPDPGERIRIHDDALNHQPFMDLLHEQQTIDRFVPKDWTGIKMEPIKLRVDPNMPKERKIPSRSPPFNMIEAMKKELTRLCTYMYVPSKSPIVSGMVTAEKKTPPFVRLCGDYRWVNKYLLLEHAYMPDVRDQLQRLAGFNYYVELDLTNSFHQFPLDNESSELLSLLTMFGALKPKFMPEGIKPASSILQNTMTKIFNEVSDHVIVIFDNIVIGAKDMQQLTERFRNFINICTQYNLHLKVTKSYFGVTQLDFFGYEVNASGYRLSDDKRSAVKNVEFPLDSYTTKAKVERMQQFLGLANFHRPLYVQTPNKPRWVDLTSPLYSMTEKNFSWDRSTWTMDYEQAFNDLRDALVHTATLYFPDFNLPFVLQTDASMNGIGGVLFQIKMEGGREIRQPIGTVSQKFSGPATRWSTFKQEAYGIFRCVEKLEHLLRGKEFVIETDHSNLQYIEKSKVAILNRWRLYLQTFNIAKIKHIKGKENVYSDCLSRGFNVVDDNKSDDDTDCEELSSMFTEEEMAEFNDFEDHDVYIANVMDVGTYEHLHKSIISDKKEYPVPIKKYDDMIETVHGGSNLHFATDITWKRLNHYIPGHCIPKDYIQRYIDYCPGCQKTARHAKDHAIVPEIKTLSCNNEWTRIGIDLITMDKVPDKYGNKYAHVIVNHFTKFVFIYPSADKSAEAAANAILTYRALYGPVSELISDPGSDYMSEVVSLLNKYLSVHQKVSLVDRHESNGVEPFNGQIRRHIQALTIDNGYKENWSDPMVISIIINNLNSIPRKSTGGYSAFQMRFGLREDGRSFDIQIPDSNDPHHEYIIRLTDIIKRINDKSKEFQIKNKEIAINKNKPFDSNKYQAGDLVLVFDRIRESKSVAPLLGPYKVIEQIGNDVKLFDLVKGCPINTKHVSELRPYNNDDMDKAIDAARSDNSEFVIDKIISYFGNPYNRTTLGFKVLFNDGTVNEAMRLDEIVHTSKLEEFINDNKELEVIRIENESTKDALKRRAQFMRNEIDPSYSKDTEIFIDIRTREIFGTTWYNQLELDNKDETLYLIPAVIESEPRLMYKRKYVVELRFAHMVDVVKGDYPHTVHLTTDRITIDGWLLKYHCYTLDQLVNKQYKMLTPVMNRSKRTQSVNALRENVNNILTVVSQNIISFYPFHKKGGLDELIKYNPDVIVLQETKLKQGNLSEVTENILPSLGYKHIVSTEGINSGVLIASKLPIKESFVLIPGRVVTVFIEDTHVTGVYLELVSTKDKLAHRLKQDVELAKHIGTLNGKSILIGDFNAVSNATIDLHYPFQLRKSLDYKQYEDATGLLLSELVHIGYQDLYRYHYPNEGVMNYTTYAIGPWKGFKARVDYIFLSKEFVMSECSIRVIRSNMSDHSVLLTDVSINSNTDIEINNMLKEINTLQHHSLNVIREEADNSDDDVIYVGTNNAPDAVTPSNVVVQNETTTTVVAPTPVVQAYEVGSVLNESTPTGMPIPGEGTPNARLPSKAGNRFWSIIFQDGTGKVFDSHPEAKAIFINMSITPMVGHRTREEAYARIMPILPQKINYIDQLFLVPEPDMSIAPVKYNKLFVIPSPFLASPMFTDKITTPGEDLQTHAHIYPGQRIACFVGNKIKINSLCDGGLSKHYILILNDEYALDCESFANAIPCKCKASKANDASGLFCRWNDRMLDINDNNAAYHYDSKTDIAWLYAVRDIVQGEVILWCYDLDPHCNSRQNTPVQQNTTPGRPLSYGMQTYLDRVDAITQAASEVDAHPDLAFDNNHTRITDYFTSLADNETVPQSPAVNLDTLLQVTPPTPPISVDVQASNLLDAVKLTERKKIKKRIELTAANLLRDDKPDDTSDNSQTNKNKRG